jgi:hypothetical protein
LVLAIQGPYRLELEQTLGTSLRLQLLGLIRVF